VLGPLDDALADLTLGDWAERGTTGMRVSPSTLAISAMKLSKAYDQVYEREHLNKIDDWSKHCLTRSLATRRWYVCTYSGFSQLSMFWNISCKSSTILSVERLLLIS
jgi:hypothetical protein